MSDKLTLTLDPRTITGKANRHLRIEGKTPAVVYGHGLSSQVVAADSRLLEKLYTQAGGNKIVELKVGTDKVHNALIHQIQRDVVNGQIIHADFYIVKMNEKIKTSIPLHITGESTAVYQQEGTLVRPLESVEVEALPGNLPEHLEVDISVLDDFDKTITVGDLKAPSGVEILTPPEELIAKVEPPRSEEDMEDLDAPITEELPEGAAEDQTVISEDQSTRKESENKAAGANPAATK